MSTEKTTIGLAPSGQSPSCSEAATPPPPRPGRPRSRRSAEHWLQTASGRVSWPLDPIPEEIHIGDIAHSLANLCRFVGHCREFYSVAEHSVRVSKIVPQEIALAGLLYDASKAYTGVIAKPIKHFLSTYMLIEYDISRAIELRFGLRQLALRSGEVCAAAEILLATEKRDLMRTSDDWPWSVCATPLAETIVPMSPKEARLAFTERFVELTMPGVNDEKEEWTQ